MYDYDELDYFCEGLDDADHSELARVDLFAPHEGQARMYEQFRKARDAYGCKFFVMPIGRRFGKTTMIYGVRGEDVRNFISLAVEEGEKVAIFYPIRKDGNVAWNGISKYYDAYIESKNSTERVVYFPNGGVVEFWSLSSQAQKEAARGRDYAKVVYDETQKIEGEILEHHIEQVIKALMLDYPDSICILLGTADGKGSTFHHLARRGIRMAQRMADNGDLEQERAYVHDIEPLPIKDGHDKYKRWVTIRYTTYDNPHINAADIDEMLAGMDYLTGRQEVFCEFVEFSKKAWCYVLESKEIQDKVFVRGLKPDFAQRLYFSLDFNKQPMTCTLMQKYPLPHHLHNAQLGWYNALHFIKEFVTDADEKQGIYDIAYIVQQYIYEQAGIRVGKWYKRTPSGQLITDEAHHPILDSSHFNPLNIRITGDASGAHGSSIQASQRSYFAIFCEILGIQNVDIALEKLPKQNPRYYDSSIQVNTMLEVHPEIKVDEIGCKYLRLDMLNVPGTPERKIDKKSLPAHLGHLLDTFRYHIDSFGAGWD